jgi:hypothetical protein
MLHKEARQSKSASRGVSQAQGLVTMSSLPALAFPFVSRCHRNLDARAFDVPQMNRQFAATAIVRLGLWIGRGGQRLALHHLERHTGWLAVVRPPSDRRANRSREQTHGSSQPCPGSATDSSQGSRQRPQVPVKPGSRSVDHLPIGSPAPACGRDSAPAGSRSTSAGRRASHTSIPERSGSGRRTDALSDN